MIKVTRVFTISLMVAFLFVLFLPSKISELPLNSIEKSNYLFIDPNHEGIEWPRW